MDCYRVVVEHYKVKNYGGYTGMRYDLHYKDRKDFLERNPLRSMHDLRIIARGASANKALDLASLTPEICHITRAAEASIQSSGKNEISRFLVNWEFQVALVNIETYRAHRQEKGLIPRTEFPFIDVASLPEGSIHKTIYKYIKEKLLTPDGTIKDLENEISLLKTFIVDTFQKDGYAVTDI